MLQEGHRRRPAGGPQANGAARSRGQEATQEAEEVSSLLGCVTLGELGMDSHKVHGSEQSAVAAQLGRRPWVAASGALEWQIESLFVPVKTNGVSHRVPHWGCHVP